MLQYLTFDLLVTHFIFSKLSIFNYNAVVTLLLLI